MAEQGVCCQRCVPHRPNTTSLFYAKDVLMLFESLEIRRLLDGSYEFTADGTLLITGTAGNDLIEIGPSAFVSVNATVFNFAEIPIPRPILRFEVRALDGNDKISFA